MNQQQLAHILRSASTVAGDPDVLVLGSQAILGTFDETQLPPGVLLSMEVDIAFLDDPDRAKADAVEGAIGEMSTFHETNMVYAEGVHVDTAELPGGWRNRLRGWNLRSSSPAKPQFPDPHDLVASKLAAYREKDFEYAAHLLDAQIVDLDVLQTRAQMLPRSASRVANWIESYRNRRGI